MLMMVKGHFGSIPTAADAVVKKIGQSVFDGIARFDVVDYFVRPVMVRGSKMAFDIYMAVEIEPSHSRGSKVKVAALASAERWPGLIQFHLTDENNAPLKTDAPPHILSQLSPPLTKEAASWRERCLGGPRWYYLLEIAGSPESGYSATLTTERQFEQFVIDGQNDLTAQDVQMMIRDWRRKIPSLDVTDKKD